MGPKKNPQRKPALARPFHSPTAEPIRPQMSPPIIKKIISMYAIDEKPDVGSGIAWVS
jgi:hypothetical protein